MSLSPRTALACEFACLFARVLLVVRSVEGRPRLGPTQGGLARLPRPVCVCVCACVCVCSFVCLFAWCPSGLGRPQVLQDEQAQMRMRKRTDTTDGELDFTRRKKDAGAAPT